MPLMLEDPMAVDLPDANDLFGDLTLPPRPAGKHIAQLLDQQRRRGCSQTIAWSKAGTIASISRDGINVELRYIRCSPDDGSWDLSEPTTSSLIQGSHSLPLVHLEWANTSSPELAIIDAAGRVAVLAFSISLNHPYVSRRWDSEHVDDLHAVAATHWLAVASQQQKPYNILYGPATKHGHAYSYESSFIHPMGPSHPFPGKSAMLCMTLGGALKMYWPQNTNRIEETTKDLESVNSSGDLVTHAAITSDRKHLLVAVATSTKQIRLVKVEIHWGGPTAQTDKASMSGSPRLNPSLVEKHLAAASWLQSGPNDSDQDHSTAELCQLHVLPSVLDNTGQSQSPPVVVTVRCRSMNDDFQVPQTILDRWEAVEKRQELHEGFTALGNRRNSVTSELPSVTCLQKLDPIVMDKVLVHFQVISSGKTVLLGFADGSVEFRDRFTFEELYVAEDKERITNLRQVGWMFPDTGPCQQIALSPTCCSLVQLGDDGKVRWNRLYYPLGDIGENSHDASYGATIAGLTLAAASATWYQSNYDDLMAIAKPFATKRRFIHDFITELIKALKISIDYSDEIPADHLPRNSSLHSCLSIMNSLGFKGVGQARSFQSKLAMIELTCRNIMILITLSSNAPSNYREKLVPLDEHEVVDALYGCVKWALDLISWVADSLFALMNDEEFMKKLGSTQEFSGMNAYLAERNEICLHLVLSSSSRGFLLALCKRIVHLEALSLRATEFYRRHTGSSDPKGPVKLPNMQLQKAYERMQEVCTTTMVKIESFEKLLTTLASDVRNLYKVFLPEIISKQNNAPQGKAMDNAVKTAQITFEMHLLLSAPPPPFLNVVKKLFTEDLPVFRRSTDPAQLFFANFDILEVQDDKKSLAERSEKGVFVDVFDKSDLVRTPESKWRRCTRCAAVMRDVYGSHPGFTFIVGQQRKCFCGGAWGLLPKGELIL